MRAARGRVVRGILAAAAMLMLLSACGGDTPQGTGSPVPASAPPPPIAVASEADDTSTALGDYYAEALEDAGYEVERKPGVARALIEHSVGSGEVDVYPSYAELEMAEPPAGGAGVLLGASRVSDHRVLVTTRALSERHGLRSVSDLARVPALHVAAPPVPFLASDEEQAQALQATLPERVAGLRSVVFDDVDDDAAGYAMLDAGDAQATTGYSTDAQLAGDYVALEDPEGAVHNGDLYHPAPVVSSAYLEAAPETRDVLDVASAALTLERVRVAAAEHLAAEGA